MNGAGCYAAILVISRSGANPRWDMERGAWKRIASCSPRGIKVYLLEGEESEGGENILVCPCKDSYIPGIYNKTIHGIRQVLTLHPEVKFLVRTNLSTFIIWHRLVDYLARVKPFYSGVRVNHDQWVNGWGIVMSRNCASLLADTAIQNKLENFLERAPDDVKIGRILYQLGFPCMREHTNISDYPLISYIWKFNHSAVKNARLLMRNPDCIFVRLYSSGRPLSSYLSALKIVSGIHFTRWQSRIPLRVVKDVSEANYLHYAKLLKIISHRKS